MANRRFGWHSGSLTCRDAAINNDLTIEGDLSIEGDMTFGDASTDTLSIEGYINFADGNGYIYPGDTESSTRKDGVILITGSRSGDQNTQKILDLNGAPGSDYNSWDVLTGAASGEHTVLFNIDGKRISTDATGAVTDRGINISIENQTDSSGGTLDLVGAHIKVANDGGQLENLKAGHFEVQTDGTNTVGGDVTILEVQYSDDGTTTLSGSAHGITFTGTDDIDNAFNFAGSGTGGAVEDSGDLEDSAGTDINCDGYIVVNTNAGTKYLALYDTIHS
jgi:hypothetical protein